MKADFLTKNISWPENSAIFTSLYGPERIKQTQRPYSKLVRGLAEILPEGENGIRLFIAAGRTEPGGNHGKVLAVSIHLDTAAAVSPRQDKKEFSHSIRFPDAEVYISRTGENSPAFDRAPRKNWLTNQVMSPGNCSRMYIRQEIRWHRVFL
jgi:hypothetical protein